MAFPLDAHALPMACLWAVRELPGGLPMDCPRAVHGLPVECPYTARELSTGCRWDPYGLPNWAAHEQPTACPWVHHGLTVRYP